MPFFRKKTEFAAEPENDSEEFSRLTARIRADTEALKQILESRSWRLSRSEGVSLYRATGALLGVKRAAAAAYHATRAAGKSAESQASDSKQSEIRN